MKKFFFTAILFLLANLSFSQITTQNRYIKYPSQTGGSDSMLLTGKTVGYYEPSNIGGTNQDDVVSAWTDSSGNGNDINSGEGGTLHFDSVTGDRQIAFNGTDQRLYIADGTVFNYVGGTDEYALVIKMGEGIVNSTNYPLQKATGGSVQYGFWSRTNSSYIKLEIGNSETFHTTDVRTGNDLIIINVRTTGVDMWWNGVKIIDNASVGTASYTDAYFCVGGRKNSAGTFDSFTPCKVERIGVYNASLTAQEITNINTEYN